MKLLKWNQQGEVRKEAEGKEIIVCCLSLEKNLVPIHVRNTPLSLTGRSSSLLFDLLLPLLQNNPSKRTDNRAGPEESRTISVTSVDSKKNRESTSFKVFSFVTFSNPRLLPVRIRKSIHYTRRPPKPTRAILCGKVLAVDSDSNMIQQAKSNLSTYSNVQVIHSSKDKVNLPAKVDVIFSNSAIHWILDQDGLFSHFWQLLKPNGGELLIECDGHGSLDKAAHIAFKIMQSDQFKGYFAIWKQSWYFPKPDDTERLLQKIGFRDIQINLSDRTMVYPDLESFLLFVKTVIVKPFLSYLPNDEKKK